MAPEVRSTDVTTSEPYFTWPLISPPGLAPVRECTYTFTAISESASVAVNACVASLVAHVFPTVAEAGTLADAIVRTTGPFLPGGAVFKWPPTESGPLRPI